MIHQKEVADQLSSSIRCYAVTMEQILGTKLHGKLNEEIKGLSANSIEDIVNKVYDEVCVIYAGFHKATTHYGDI